MSSCPHIAHAGRTYGVWKRCPAITAADLSRPCKRANRGLEVYQTPLSTNNVYILITFHVPGAYPESSLLGIGYFLNAREHPQCVREPW
jgi:hypothetical protein